MGQAETQRDLPGGLNGRRIGRGQNAGRPSYPGGDLRLRPSAAMVLGRKLRVFGQHAGQESEAQRGPGNDGDSPFPGMIEQAALECPDIEHVQVDLNHRRIECSDHRERFGRRLGRNSPGSDMAGFLQPMQFGGHVVGQGGGWNGMELQQVDPVGSQTGKAALHRPADGLGGKVGSGRPTLVSSLGCDDHMVATPPERAADQRFAASVTIGRRRIVEGDAMIEGPGQSVQRCPFIDVAIGGRAGGRSTDAPATEADFGNLDAGAAEIAVEHGTDGLVVTLSGGSLRGRPVQHKRKSRIEIGACKRMPI